MRKIFVSLIVVLLFVVATSTQIIISTKKATAQSAGGGSGGGSSSSAIKYSGGKISVSPATAYTTKESECKSMKPCKNACSATWVDTSKLACSGGTFSLSDITPKSASGTTEYCAETGARAFGGKIDSSKLILNRHKAPTATVVGTCTCMEIKGPDCIPNPVTISTNLAHTDFYGVSK